MSLGDEELDVHRLAIAYVAWVYEKAANLDGVHRAARDQWPRASQSIPLIIAKGNGNTELDRMASMLSRLGGRGYQVPEETVTYGQCEAELNAWRDDSDSDLDEERPQPPAGGDGEPAPQPCRSTMGVQRCHVLRIQVPRRRQMPT